MPEQISNPVSMDDLIVAIKRNDEGMAIMMNAKTRGELMKALMEIQMTLIQEVINLNIKMNPVIKDARGKLAWSVSVDSSLQGRVSLGIAMRSLPTKGKAESSALNVKPNMLTALKLKQ